MAPACSTRFNSLHVAVIGAGAAGLAAARELRRESHSVVVFERSAQVGGLWVYTPQTEPDPLSLDPNRTVVHSSVYASLRTNLPRECMGYRDFPFVPRDDDDESRDPRRYPSYGEVLAYLRDFAREFELEEMVRFETEVVYVERDGRRWKIRSRNSGGVFKDEIFDSVVVCNGHYTEPRVAHVPGNQAGGRDISKDIAAMAKEVRVASISRYGKSTDSSHCNKAEKITRTTF
ncbi:hypothetical protein Bca52824_013204 [Brassica carinata]|uniref:Flavin-containing monooxygenase n=1 Tax=Brassica carinata TaxID=52824 RepID=A0A8X7VYY6_BRACI|nr:hypothetical protein Bca52824_013204 [Brassica carinata]